MEPTVHTEISLIHNEQPHRFNFRANVATKARIEEALTTDSDALEDWGARDVQCRPWPFLAVACSATELAEEMGRAVGGDHREVDEDDGVDWRGTLAQVRHQAARLDALSPQTSDAPFWTARWIWRDGDGPSALVQSFFVGPSAAAQAAGERFCEALDLLVTGRDRAHGFEVRQKPPEPVAAGEALNQLLALIESHDPLDPIGGNTKKNNHAAPALRALATQISLEQTVPQASLSRVSPRL